MTKASLQIRSRTISASSARGTTTSNDQVGDVPALTPPQEELESGEGYVDVALLLGSSQGIAVTGDLDPAGATATALASSMQTGTGPGACVEADRTSAAEFDSDGVGEFRGNLDKISDTLVMGWLMLCDQPSTRCIVALKEGSRVLARALATQFRPDLLEAGIGDGCYGFSLTTPHSFLDGEEHAINVVDENSGYCVSGNPVTWRAAAGTAPAALLGFEDATLDDVTFPTYQPPALERLPAMERSGHRSSENQPTISRSDSTVGPGTGTSTKAQTNILFDISDLVYYIGHHPNLTGIQRVQSSIVLSYLKSPTKWADITATFLTFNARSRRWTTVPSGFLTSLLQDLFLPDRERLVSFSREDARYGRLPGAADFDGIGLLDDGHPSVLCLLGAAWVQRDYFHRVLSFKRRFGTRFVMMVHDLIPIYARSTCDQGTANVFEEFLRRALRHVDHYLSVSQSTAKDLGRYIKAANLPLPAVTVTLNGSSFREFLKPITLKDRDSLYEVPDRFVLFVSTIEGRKNHQLMLDVWRRMADYGDNPPHLVCVGRIGWRSERFIAELVESNYLNGKVVLLQGVSDAHLQLLYEKSLFSVCPSLYEGWGLPIGESLAAGKVCVCSDRTSLPEVAGEFGVYINIESLEDSYRVIRGLIVDNGMRRGLEDRIRSDYRPLAWRQVADTILTACRDAALVEWSSPYPHAAIPYSSEISFAAIHREMDSTFGDGLLDRIIDARRGHFLTEPLQEVNFLLGEDARAGGAWAEPEAWGTWLCHDQGEIVLALGADRAQTYYVFLKLRVSGGVANVPVRLLANGDVSWRGQIGDKSRSIMLRVRKRSRSGASDGWRLTLRAETDLTTVVEAVIAAADSRVPTIGFERLVVVPETDLKTRLDVLTGFVLSASSG